MAAEAEDLPHASDNRQHVGHCCRCVGSTERPVLPRLPTLNPKAAGTAAYAEGQNRARCGHSSLNRQRRTGNKVTRRPRFPG